MYSASLFLQQVSYSESNSDATSDAEYNNVSSKDRMWKLAKFEWLYSELILIMQLYSMLIWQPILISWKYSYRLLHSSRSLSCFIETWGMHWGWSQVHPAPWRSSDASLLIPGTDSLTLECSAEVALLVGIYNSTQEIHTEALTLPLWSYYYWLNCIRIVQRLTMVAEFEYLNILVLALTICLHD